MATEVTTGLYPFDPYGTNPENLVLNEKQALQTPGRDDFYFIIPKAAPFFVKSLVVRSDQTDEVYVEGEDYVVGHYFVEAMTKTGRPIAGSIRFLKRDITGIVSLTYQTVGGEWGFDDAAILEELSNKMVNPLTRAWAQIDVLPVAFPPIPHDQVVDDLIGFEDVIDAIGNIVTAIQAAEEGQFTQHMLNTDNPHSVTKSQVGLGNVPNYVMATDPEGEEGIRSDRFMSPRATKAAIDAQALAPHNVHLADTSNPHGVTKAQVGLSNVENFVFATDQEARDASLSSRYMSPRGVGQALDEFYDVRLAPMLSGDPDNPTGVTKESIGLGNVENYAPASQPEMVAGDRNDRYTTPLRVFEAIDFHALIPLGQHTANTNNPHGVTPAQIGTFTQAEIQTLIEGRLAAGATAVDSNLVYGLDQPALYDDILTNTIANSLQLEGKSLAEVLLDAAELRVADSEMFDGLTSTQWLGEIETAVENSFQDVGAPLVTEYPLEIVTEGEYVLLLQREEALDETETPLPMRPVSLLLTYGQPNGLSPSVQLNVGGLNDPVTLVALNDEPWPLEFFSTLDGATNTLSVWAKVPASAKRLHALPISKIDALTFQLFDTQAGIDASGDPEATQVVVTTLDGLSPLTVNAKNTVLTLIDELTTAFDTATAEL